MRSDAAAARLILFAAATMLLVAAPGCVRRRMTVRTNPPGAFVYVDDQPIGYSPVSTPYTYYGTRKIQAVKDGYQTETVLEKVRPPWYQIPPLDFVSENLWPAEIRDERIVDLHMRPQQLTPPDELRSRAEQLRTQARQGYVAPASAQAPVGAPPIATGGPGGIPFGAPGIPTAPPGALPPGALPPGTGGVEIPAYAAPR